MADLTITARDGSGSFGGYLALPESGSGPGVIVIQEIFGVNAGMRRICDWLAGAGYVA
ncbi:MAG: dienelactone hydrolase family protein, partial [Alphaproteobacteria bacterium]